MVQAKKFEQTFINEYLAWNLHEQDVERRGHAAGRKEGEIAKAINAAKNLLAMRLGTHEQIARAVGLPLEKIDELAEKL